MNNNICIYIRTASNDEKAVDMQRTQLNEYVAELSDSDTSTTLKEFVDMGYSGLSTELPALQDIFTLAKAGEVDVLVTTTLDRFSRNVSKARELIQHLDNLGVLVEFSSNNQTLLEEDGAEANNHFTKTVLDTVAQQERTLRSQKIKNGIKKAKMKKENGEG